MWLTKITSRKYYHKPPGNPNLSTIKVSELLRKTEASWKYPNSILHRVDVSSCAANQPMEDAHFQTILNNGSACFGILDGHWTNDCSKLVAYALPRYIEKYIKDANIKTSLKEAFEQLDKDILGLPWKSLPTLSNSLKEIESLDPKQKLQTLLQCLPTFSGSCAITANLYQNDLFIAHAGDCRAILGIRDGTGWVSKALTLDHQPSNLRELSRLHQDHPGEEETVASKAGDGPLRVLGILFY